MNILKYSIAQADRHIKAMRLLKELPQIEEKTTSGEISLTNVAKVKEFFIQEEKLAPMKPETKLEVLKKLENKSTVAQTSKTCGYFVESVTSVRRSRRSVIKCTTILKVSDLLKSLSAQKP